MSTTKSVDRQILWFIVGTLLLTAAMVICIVVPLTIGATYCYDPESVEHEKARMRPVIETLSKYEAVNGKFPDDLTTLTPGFISSIPQSALGVDYTYRSYGDQYDLCFFAPIDGCSCGGCCYMQRFEDWECCTHGHSEGRP